MKEKKAPPPSWGDNCPFQHRVGNKAEHVLTLKEVGLDSASGSAIC